MNANRSVGLEKQKGWDVGRDPREMTRAELELLGHGKKPLLRAMRARCIDCCAGELSRVRRCAQLGCPSWPYRMGTNPWQAPLSAEVLEARRRGGRRRAAQFKISAQGGGSDAERRLPAANHPAEPSAPQENLPEQVFQAEAGGEASR